MGACSTIVEGTSQEIGVATEPPGASCDIHQGDAYLGTIVPTPGSITVAKESSSILVSCEKDGYQNASKHLDPDFAAMTAGNIIFGGLVGVVVDAVSGASNKYPNSVSLVLRRKTSEALIE